MLKFSNSIPYSSNAVCNSFAIAAPRDRYSVPSSLTLTSLSFIYRAIVIFVDSITSDLNCSYIKSIFAAACVPTNFNKNKPPSLILTPYCPLADILIGTSKYGSTTRRPPAPQRRFLFSSLLTNQTLALKVDSPPEGKFIIFSRIGIFAEDRTCRPAVNLSHNVPFL